MRLCTIAFAALPFLSELLWAQSRTVQQHVVPSSRENRAIRLATPPAWFETFFEAAQISPDGTHALDFAAGVRLIDLRSGRDEALWKGLDGVQFATFDGHSRVLLGGSLAGRMGLYRQGAAGPVYVALPKDALQPRWSSSDNAVAFIRAGVSDSVFVATDSATVHGYRLPKRVASIAWLPGDKAILALTTDSNTMSSLWRLQPSDGALDLLAKDLDAGARGSLAVAADGNRAYLPLASPGKPNVLERNRPHAPRAFNIYEVNLRNGTRRIFASAGDGGDFVAPGVSPNQVFWTHTRDDASIVVLPVSGGVARTVIRDAQEPYWRPDGKQIGFYYGDQRLADWAINWDGGAVDVDANGRATGALLPLITGYAEDFPPVWSPNGRWIAYHSHRSPHPISEYGAAGSSDDIWLKRAPTPSRDTNAIRLTDFGWEAGPPDWSRDGTRLLFSSYDRAGRPGVSLPWLVTIDTATGRPISHGRLPLPPQVHNASWVAWSPVNDSIAIEEEVRPGRHALWIVAADGSGGRKLLEYAMRTYGGLAWAPDGKSIVYAAIAGDFMQLYSISVTGGEPRQLTHEAANIFQPRVSPDGRLIAATRLAHHRELMHRPLDK